MVLNDDLRAHTHPTELPILPAACHIRQHYHMQAGAWFHMGQALDCFSPHLWGQGDAPDLLGWAY